MEKSRQSNVGPHEGADGGFLFRNGPWSSLFANQSLVVPSATLTQESTNGAACFCGDLFALFVDKNNPVMFILSILNP